MIILKAILRLVSRGVRQIAMHKVSSAIVALLLIALIFVSTAKVSEPGPAQAKAKNASQPIATENYFKGQQSFDSQLIWSSLSPELIGRAEMSGATINDLQQQLDSARELGRTLEQVSYIGGYDLRDGGSMQFYVATVKSGDSLEDVDEIFYVFTLDKDGKIVSIE